MQRQRPAALAGALLVRAEGRLHPHRTAGAGHPEHLARPYPARLPLAGRGARFAGKVQSDGRHDPGAGPESDFGRRMNSLHHPIKAHKKCGLWCTKVCCTSHLNNLHESL